MSSRNNFVIALIGANGTGKTTNEIEMIQKWRTSRPKEKVIGYDPHKQLGSLIDFHINSYDKNWAAHIHSKCRNSLIVLDDYKGLLPNYIPGPGMRDMFIDRRFHNNDFIYSVHSPSNIIEMLIDYTTHYYIYYTSNTEGRFRDKMPNAELCIAASRAVNKYVSMYDFGKHPNDPEFKGQKFPYVIVDVKHRKLTAVNMHNKLKF